MMDVTEKQLHTMKRFFFLRLFGLKCISGCSQPFTSSLEHAETHTRCYFLSCILQPGDAPLTLADAVAAVRRLEGLSGVT